MTRGEEPVRNRRTSAAGECNSRAFHGNEMAGGQPVARARTRQTPLNVDPQDEGGRVADEDELIIPRPKLHQIGADLSRATGSRPVEECSAAAETLARQQRVARLPPPSKGRQPQAVSP